MADFKLDLVPDLEYMIGHHPIVHAESIVAAQKIAAIARDIGPVVTGAYVNGISVQETKGGARVLADDEKSHWIEFGIPGQGQPPQFVLRRAAEQAGYKFVKKA